MTGYSQLTQSSSSLQVTYYSQSKVVIHLSSKLNSANNKSEGLSYGYNEV